MSQQNNHLYYYNYPVYKQKQPNKLLISLGQEQNISTIKNLCHL